jgi:D-lactate dehydrogenase (cytochrome)
VALTLLFEFHSEASATFRTRRKRCRPRRDRGGKDLEWAVRLEDRERPWCARQYTMRRSPFARCVQITDVCASISRLAECPLETKQDNLAAPFPIAPVGRAGDGNFHPRTS